VRSGLGTVYLIVGVIVAATHDYFEDLSTVKLILEAVVAVLIWPFVLAGVEIDFK
jgi:hypothetical protein